MNHFCTIVNCNYLDRVWTLDESRRTWCGEFPLHILVLDEHSMYHLERLAKLGYTANIQLWYWDQVIGQELIDVQPTRSWHEWVWTVKPYWILFLMQNLEKGWLGLTYIDGDMEFFNHPRSMFEELENHTIGITPHRFSSSYERYEINGVFNGAFVHVKPAKNASSCIAHWASQCLRRCSLEHSPGSFVDQKYLDTWPDQWGAHRLQHKGVNLAPWNQGEAHYAYSRVGDHIMVDDQPLVLYHYHGGPNTAYLLDPFVREQIYKPYVIKLERARGLIEQCAH